MKWYQSAIINGQAMPAMRRGDTHQKRWANLIKPLLPKPGGLLIELGSNAGFYLREAKDLGFEVLGMERDREFVNQANFWEAKDPKGVKTLEGDVVGWDMPCASVVLMPNLHYWLRPNEISRLIRRLIRKTPYVLVVGRFKHHPDMLSANDEQTLKNIFNKWQIVKTTKTNKHYAYLFKGYLEAKPVNKLVAHLKTTEHFYPAFREFIEGREEWYLGYLKKRLSRKGPEYLVKHRELVKDVKEKGILKPILCDGDHVVNGSHRLVLADYLGLKEIICQQLSI